MGSPAIMLPQMSCAYLVIQALVSSPSPVPNTGASQAAQTTAGSARRNLFSSSIALAQYSFTLQLLLRVITFALNGLAFRHLDAGVLGIINFRLGLYYSTLVFAARESFRRACLSRGGELLSQQSFGDGPSLRSDRQRLWYGLLNVMWLTVPAGFLMIFVLLPVWLFVWPSPTLDKTVLAIDPTALARQYTVSALVYSLSALFELATEPLCRIALEAIANIARAVGIVVSVVYLPKTYGLYLLACPQILHGITLLVGYVLFFAWALSQRRRDSVFGVLPIASPSDLLPNLSEASFDQPCLRLSWGFFRQGILKQFLTEGERYLISAFHLLSFSDQVDISLPLLWVVQRCTPQAGCIKLIRTAAATVNLCQVRERAFLRVVSLTIPSPFAEHAALALVSPCCAAFSFEMTLKSLCAVALSYSYR
ncbi:unnamed protein product [Dibothriocephalus latus]|uniref:Protein RFT1 homolog n=1 Tax=Dibothriocephalus latus TaxID=60516 RepID=A0A3P7LIL1_DIBLA|nr:unnamed protein product [Dibothriocephalus latus]